MSKNMSKKQRQLADDDEAGAIAFEVINREISLLLKRLAAKGICPCCAGQGMAYRGIFLHQEVAGTEETIALCLDIADLIGQPDGTDEAMPASNTEH